MNRTRLISALLFLAAACDGSSTSPLPPEFQLDHGPVWDGAEVVITSEAFATARHVIVRAGDSPDSLPLREVSASELAVRLPSLAQDAVGLSIELDGKDYFLANLSVRGYTGFRELPEPLTEHLILWPRSRASVLTGNLGGMLLIDLFSGSIARFPGTGSYGFGGPTAIQGPGITHIDGLFLSSEDIAGHVEAWWLLPFAQSAGSPPLDVGNSRLVMQLNESAWATASSSRLSIRSQLGVMEASIGLFYGLHMSPRADRATFRFEGSLSDLPVLDAKAATVAYQVAGMQVVPGADFSGDGELLAIAGGGWPSGPFRVLMLRAGDGTVLQERPLDGRPFTLTLDPALPLVYVGIVEAGRPVVLVLDRETLALRARLVVPDTVPECSLECFGGVIARSAEPALYVLKTDGSTVVYRFTMDVD